MFILFEALLTTYTRRKFFFDLFGGYQLNVAIFEIMDLNLENAGDHSTAILKQDSPH